MKRYHSYKIESKENIMLRPNKRKCEVLYIRVWKVVVPHGVEHCLSC